MTLSLGSLASLSARRPWWTLLGSAIVLAIALVATSTIVPGALDGEDGPTKTLEFERAENLRDQRFADLDEESPADGQGGPDAGGQPTLTEFILISSDTALPGDPEFTAFLQDAATRVSEAASELVVGGIDEYQPQVSEDGTTLLISVQIFESHESDIELLIDAAAELSRDGFLVQVFGDASINHTFEKLAEEDLTTGESIGIGVALIILALVFGAVVAALIPILLAIAAIIVAIGLTGVLGQFVELNEFVPNIMTMMGLAVGIDYSLFILSRYREERAHGLSQEDAVNRAWATAGRAVVFSGITVVLALLGMLLIPERVFQAFGVGSILVVFVAVFASLTLLPATVGILGDRVNAVRAPLIPTIIMFGIGVVIVGAVWGIGPNVMLVAGTVFLLLIISALARRFAGIRIPGLGSSDETASVDDRKGFWNTITVAVMKKPLISMAAAVVFLLVLSYFYLDLEKGTSGIAVLPDEEPAKQAFQSLDDKFGFGSDAPALVAIDGDVGTPEITRAIELLEAAMIADPGLQDPVIRIEPGVELATLTSNVPGDPNNQQALNTIRRLRSDLIPTAFQDVPTSDYNAYVGGGSALVVDSVQMTDDYMPIVIGTVLTLSFILLLFAFRSITISIASIIMNLLSVGAAYGLVVLVFQKGFLIDLFGFEQVEQIEFWLPLFMFSILFGLSMDYHVFMLSRIKERFDETGDAAESVAFGLRTTASIITGAALIMVAVFGGFALGQIAFFQAMGFGLGAAVLLDATIVRSLLVPSVMRLLGERAWYFPGWLEWMPNISIEGSPEAGAQVPEGVPAGGDD
ncbi:MAG: MMPL family transporter [Chloroflexi bacterium]|jgi:putative drug exporter of the RND superfamily|nr:MMPL family transporter [Chloroflexota bacterium]MBT4516019.1 MMPL family transporter [Chloroflexota bacterium]MBT6682546.1 MMPL family transporter [Chloroflexota bacterium]